MDRNRRSIPWGFIFKNITELDWITRVAFALVALICIFIGALVHSDRQHFQDVQCPNIDYADGINYETVDDTKRHGFESGYRLVEYLQHGNSRQKNTKKNIAAESIDEIPILVIPGFQNTVDSQQFLAKLVYDQTKNKNFRFRWFAIDFIQEDALTSSDRIEKHFGFANNALKWIRKQYPDQYPIIIGNSYGGVIGQMLVSALNRNATQYWPAMLILESAPMNNPGYDIDEKAKNIGKQMKERWINKDEPFAPMGVVSFSGGVSDWTAHPSSTKFLAYNHVPVWTIEGVPDNGITAKHMLTCGPFLHHVSNLLMSYGNEHFHKSGKAIVNSFYTEWNNRKRDKLPGDWRNDSLEHAITIRAGERHEIIMNGSKWVNVALERNEYIFVNMTGTCLNAATLIRSQRLIRRKDELIDNRRFEFGIFQVKQFEDVRMLLESHGECIFVIETTSPWFIYGQRFYDGLTENWHNFWVAALITTTYMIVLEGQKRSTRYEEYLEFYLLFVFTVFYHAFHSIGTQFSGAICGIGASLLLYFIPRYLDEFCVWWFRRSPDRLIRLYQKPCFDMCLIISAVCNVFALKSGLALMLLMYSLKNRLFAVFPMTVWMIPLFSKIWDVKFFREQIHIPTSYYLYSVMLAMYGIYILKSKYQNFPILNRFWLHLIVYSIFILQISFSYYSLEFHYITTLIILIINDNSVQLTPRMLLEERIDPNRLENEYQMIEESVEGGAFD